MKLSELTEAVRGVLHGNGDVEITGVASLEDATGGTITFLADRRYAEGLSKSRASAFILPPGVSNDKVPFITCENPLLAFAEVIRLFHPIPSPKGIDARAIIEKDARVGQDVTIYPGAYVGEGATLGDRVTLYPGTYVGSGARIGDDSVLFPNVVIYDGNDVGKRVIIHGGTIIGADGYGFVWDGERHRKIPQVGRVVIGDDVEIGANCTIDRATLGVTEIKRGAKLDNMVHIAHNCTVGEDALIVGQVGIAGSSSIGNRVIIAAQSGVSDHVTVGDDVIIGARSGIIKDLEAGAKVSGYPPLPHMKWLRVQKTLEDLPEIKKKVDSLGRKIEKIEKKE